MRNIPTLAPTRPSGDNSNAPATTAFVSQAISAAVSSNAGIGIFSSVADGLVPASGGSSLDVLYADATFRSLPAASSAPPAFTRIEAGSVGTATSFIVSSISAYNVFLLQFASVSHNSGASQNLQIEISLNNGSSWSTAVNLTQASFGAASTVQGTVNLSVDGGGSYYITNQVAGNTGGIVSLGANLNAIRLSPTGGSFDGGFMILWGSN